MASSGAPSPLGEQAAYHGVLPQLKLRMPRSGASWHLLEEGLEVQFRPSTPANCYRSGDYWLIPARAATGEILWPDEGETPKAIAPHGVDHYYAPLGVVSFNACGILET